MNNKFQNKYRIPSARFKNWDYGNNGAYFITICAQNREHFFGEIISVADENEMQLNEIEKLAEPFWAEIPNHFPFVELGNYTIMPNHIHGILIINKQIIVDDIVETLQCNISTVNTTENINKKELMAEISPKSGTISTIIRSYKSALTKNAHFMHADFELQARFHDHIIRDSESFERIQNYIETNPELWKEDKFYN
ncbi:transposase [Flavobacterium sp. GB2R13]|uniref:transposase n=1 Tax=Flavobacterium algoris TaxID=3398733 RepID=UPI003A86EAD5